MVSVSFFYPSYLWFLLLIPFFIFVYFFSLGYNKKKSFVFANFEALERFYGLEFFSKNFMALYMNLAVLFLVIMALAGLNITFTASTSAYSYVIMIDNSGSMATTDLEPNRFLVAKSAAKDFVNAMPLGVNIGVIGFSGEADVYQRITSDKLKVKLGIDNIEYGEVEGTNIYNALIAADRLFDNTEDEKFRSVVVISDGQVNVGEAPQILSFAERNEIVINTVGVGSPEGGISKYNTISKADIDFLKSLAFNTGGTFFRVEEIEDFEETFNLLVDRVDDDIEVDVSIYLLLFAVVLFTVNWILFNLRMKTLP